MSRRRLPAKLPSIDDLLAACFERGQALFVGELSGLHVGVLSGAMGGRFVAVQQIPIGAVNPEDHEAFADLRRFDAVCLAVCRAPNGVHVVHRMAGLPIVRELKAGETIVDAWIALTAPGDGSAEPFRRALPGGLGGVEVRDGKVRLGHMGAGRRGAIEIDVPKRADVEETLRAAAGAVLGRILG